jgi:hypothetical protein
MIIEALVSVAIQTTPWRLESVRDGMNDSLSVFVSTEVDGEALAIGCLEGQLLVTRISSEVLGRGDRRDEPAFRFPGAEASRSRWTYTMNAAHLYGRDADAFTRGMAASDTVLTRLITYRGETIDRHFSTEGSAEGVDAVRVACRLSTLTPD